MNIFSFGVELTGAAGAIGSGDGGRSSQWPTPVLVPLHGTACGAGGSGEIAYVLPHLLQLACGRGGQLKCFKTWMMFGLEVRVRFWQSELTVVVLLRDSVGQLMLSILC